MLKRTDDRIKVKLFAITPLQIRWAIIDFRGRGETAARRLAGPGDGALVAFSSYADIHSHASTPVDFNFRTENHWNEMQTDITKDTRINIRIETNYFFLKFLQFHIMILL